MGVELGLVGIGLNVLGKVGEGVGKKAQMDQASAQAQRSARAGRVAADQTDVFMREELATTIGNIKAQRAAAGVDPNSPTTEAILREEERVSDRQRVIKVGNIRSQAKSDSDASSFYRRSGQSALGWSTIGAFGTGLTMATGVDRRRTA